MPVPRLLTGRRRRLLARLTTNGLLQALAAVATLALVQRAFDRLIAGGAAGEALVLEAGVVAAGLALAALANVWLQVRERADAELLGQDYAKAVRLALFDQLSGLPSDVLQRRTQGGLMLRFVGDLTALRQWVSLGLARLVVSTLAGLGAVVALAWLNPVLAGSVALVLAVGTTACLGLGPRLRLAAREARRRSARLAANVNEKIGAMAVVQVFGQAERERRRLDRQARRVRDSAVTKARLAGVLRAATEGTAALAYAVPLVLGAFEVASGRATPGTVVAAMAIVGLLAPRLRDLGRVQEYWHGSRVARAKLEEFMALPALPRVRNAAELAGGPGRIEFRDVTLGVIEGFSAIAEPGGVVAVVGPNGAGKSTLLKLAARLADPRQGAVLLDGQDLSRHELGSVRRALGMVSPDLPLLRGSLDYNLRYRWPDAPEEEVARVRALCGLDDMAAELGEGFDTRVAERGLSLSAGQRQRIALARALLGAPRVLLLDEADANLDPQAAGVIDRVLAERRSTVLIVTHRPDRLAAADVVWHLERGRLAEAGPARQLMAAGGATAKLFGSVFRPRLVDVAARQGLA